MLRVGTFRDLLVQASASFESQPFLIDDERLGQVSYRDVLSFARGLERQLDTLGVPCGARVATIFHNSGLAALMFLGVIASRRVLVPLNPASTRDELNYMLARSECSAVFLDPADSKLNSYGEQCTITISDHRAYFDEQVRNGAHLNLWATASNEPSASNAEIVFTSGSTGRPKGILLSERSLLADAMALAEVYALDGTDRFLTVCPLFHNSGQVFTTLGCALVGGSTAAIKSDIGMFHFWTYVEKYRAHWSLGMVSFLALLLSRPQNPVHAHSMRGLLTGGSVIDAALIQQFEARFRTPVRAIYGLTESASISTCEFIDPTPRSIGSSGRPLSICDVRIGSKPEDLAASDDPRSHSRGEIWIAGPNVFESYVGDPDLTLRRKQSGWLQTGDLGYFDENGNLFVVDRLDSMLIVGGENVYPAEVEKLCTVLPGATQIVLGGLDHPIWGKELVLVYKTENAEKPPLKTWHRIISEQVTKYKVPQRFVAIEELGLMDFPRKENGKLDRQAIAALLKVRLRVA